MDTNLTPEQIQALIAQLQGGQAPQEQASAPPQTIRMQLPTGETIEGSPEEVQRRVNDAWQARQAPATAQDGSGFAFDTFQEKFMKNPVEGLDYAYKAQHKWAPSELVPEMARELLKMQGEIREMRFASNPDLKDPNARKAVEDLMSQGRARDVEDAIAIAKARGMIQAPAPATPASPAQPAPQAPPWLGASSSDNFQAPQNYEDVEKMVQDVSDDQLLKIINGSYNN